MYKDSRAQTKKEEIANSITAMIGFILGIIALTLYTSLKGDIWQIVSVSVYGTTLLLTFLSSAVYHTVQMPKLKTFFRRVDHCAIYLFIAGCYTPLILVKLRDTWGLWLLGIIWLLAIMGVIKKLFFTHSFKNVSAAVYILMGWLVILIAEPVLTALPMPAIIWLAAGGACYMLGTVFYAKDRIVFFHTVWHLLVLGGAFCHFYLMAFYVLG